MRLIRPASIAALLAAILSLTSIGVALGQASSGDTGTEVSTITLVEPERSKIVQRLIGTLSQD